MEAHGGSVNLRRCWHGLGKLLLASIGRGRYSANSGANPGTADIDSVVQLHIAEYQALTTRITYLMLAQFSIGGVVLAAFADLAKTAKWPSATAPRVWLGVLLLEIFIAAFCYTVAEMSSCNEYIAKELSLAIRCHLRHTGQFWGYEGKGRGRFYGPRGIYWMMVWAFLFPCLAAVIRYPQRSLLDYIGASLSLLLIAIVYFMARTAAQTQKRTAEYLASAVQGG